MPAAFLQASGRNQLSCALRDTGRGAGFTLYFYCEGFVRLPSSAGARSGCGALMQGCSQPRVAAGFVFAFIVSRS